ELHSLLSEFFFDQRRERLFRQTPECCFERILKNLHSCYFKFPRLVGPTSSGGPTTVQRGSERRSADAAFCSLGRALGVFLDGACFARDGWGPTAWWFVGD